MLASYYSASMVYTWSWLESQPSKREVVGSSPTVGHSRKPQNLR